jgi:hypothetical protein
VVVWDGITFTLVPSETEMAQRLFKVTDEDHGTINYKCKIKLQCVSHNSVVMNFNSQLVQDLYVQTE